MTDYNYAKGDLLEERNTYFYAQFQGVDFLGAWCQERDKYLISVGPESEKYPVEDSVGLDDMHEIWQEAGYVDGKILLNVLCEGISKLSSSPDKLKYMLLVDRLVKRFEITKRIYTTYDKEFKPQAKEEYRDLSLYLKAAEIFEKAYDSLKNLAYLNVFLKSVDTICSQYDSLDSDAKISLARLVRRERLHVLGLARDKGVIL